MKKWKPKNNEWYWYVAMDNYMLVVDSCLTWGDGECDEDINCFRTKKLAQTALKEIKKVLKKAKKV